MCSFLHTGERGFGCAGTQTLSGRKWTEKRKRFLSRGKKKVDNSLIVFILMCMDEEYRVVRKSGGQFSVTIPLKFVRKGGFNTCKLVGISQTKNGNLKIRGINIGENKSRQV